MLWIVLGVVAAAFIAAMQRASSAGSAALERVVEAGGAREGHVVVVRRSDVDVRLQAIASSEGLVLVAQADWCVGGGPAFMLRRRDEADVVYAPKRPLPPSLDRLYRLESQHEISSEVVACAEEALVARRVTVHATEASVHVTGAPHPSASNDAATLEALADVAARIASAPLDALRPRAEAIGGVIERGAIRIERASGSVRFDPSSALDLLLGSATWAIWLERAGPCFEHVVGADGDIRPAPARGTISPALLGMLPVGARVVSDGAALFVDLPDPVTDDVLRAIADALAAAPSGGTFR